jgi:D-arginine dehydrogenase
VSHGAEATAIREITDTFDFIVVGAGMAGASVAAPLASTARVALIEAEPQRGFHATARSAALFAPDYGSPFSAPSPGQARRSCTRRRRISRRIRCCTPRGALYLARADQEPQARFTPAVDARLEYGGRGSLAGSSTHEGPVPAARLPDRPEWRSEAWQVQMEYGPLPAPVLVNAAGAWADELAACSGAKRLGLRPLRRTALIDAPEGVAVDAWPAVFDVDEEFYFKPDASRLLVSPADEEPSPPGGNTHFT